MALTDLRPEGLEKTISELKKIAPDVKVLPIEMNTADEKQVFDSVTRTVKEFGSLDIAVNNAGRGGPQKATHELETKDWKSLIDVNLTGVWFCQKAQIQQMLKQEYVR
jgi:NADP-dependent 3-hydroxy acid dehydrogenase YdfG